MGYGHRHVLNLVGCLINLYNVIAVLVTVETTTIHQNLASVLMLVLLASDVCSSSMIRENRSYFTRTAIWQLG